MAIENIIKVSGTAIPIPGDNIDTDQITPADAMTELTYDSVVKYLFRDARKKDSNHPLNDSRYNGASIMLVGKNFGSGSSRETAPQAIKRYGINALVGESFAAIFEGNCRALGMPAVTASPEDNRTLMELTQREPQTAYTVDLESMAINYNGRRVQIAMPEPSRIALMERRWNALEMLKVNEHKVRRVAGALPYIGGFQ